MLLTMLAIMLEDGPRAPIFYRQRRVGLDGHEFDVLKFRSMRVDAERDGKPRWATGATIASRASAGSSARCASTSCRRSSTSCAAT